jgi:hypothetical protein
MRQEILRKRSYVCEGPGSDAENSMRRQPRRLERKVVFSFRVADIFALKAGQAFIWAKKQGTCRLKGGRR